MDINQVDVAIFKNKTNEILDLVNKEWDKIPLLNVNELHNLSEGKLVRFRGMVQDIFDPEYYLQKYEVENTQTQEKTMKDGSYLDDITPGENETIDFDNPKIVTNERVTYVLITPPGLNEWVKDREEEIYKLKLQKVVVPESSTSKHKISTENNVEMEIDEENVSKRQRIDEDTNETNENTSKSQIISAESLLNFPMPIKRGKACYAKIYSKDFDVKICDTIDCVGFLGLPNIAAPTSDNFNEMETISHNPPASLIPRIHCIAMKPLQHLNSSYCENDSYNWEDSRKELQILLTQILLGDELAAEYLILHLISKVFSRIDLHPLGKFSLNIANVPSPIISNYGEQVYQFLEMLTPLSHYVPMTLENMNTLQFVPKKDYETNRISGGVLQLSKNTHLVLDETKLTAGKLNEAGVKSVGAISRLIKDQCVNYNFNWYDITYECDVPVIVFSEGKSMLPTDCHVMLKPENCHLATFEEIVEAAKVYLKPEIVSSIRNYLTNRRMADYEIPSALSEHIQNEFLSMRADSNATAEDLHQLLVMARLIALSHGKNCLDEISFNKAREMEVKRKERLPN